MKLSQETRDAIQARAEQHIAERAKYVTGSGTGTNPPATVEDAGSPPAAKPALSPRREAIVAWDLTLRCPVCNSNVHGNCKNYHCHACERAGR